MKGETKKKNEMEDKVDPSALLQAPIDTGQWWTPFMTHLSLLLRQDTVFHQKNLYVHRYSMLQVCGRAKQRAMARWCILVLVVLALAVATSARDVPNDAGLKDQKNFMTFGGVGGYSGIGSNGLPFGGAGAGIGGGFGGGLGGGLGGTTGIGGIGGFGGNGGGVGGGVGTGIGTGLGGGSGVLPFP
ncbi:hypothetical protein CR513_37169, partial [Mucuna pruriens]